MTPLLDLASASAPAVLALALPFLLSLVAALGCAGVHWTLKRRPSLGRPAGEWLTDIAATAAPGVQVSVAPELAGSADGYWPHSRVIGLSPKTWVDRGPAGRAVASHELGHALAWRADAPRARRLLQLRALLPHARAVAGAGILTAALMDSGLAALVGFTGLLVAVLAHGATLLDEGDASLRATSVLEAHGLRSRGTDTAMLAAFSVYLAPALAHLAILVAYPWFVETALVGPARLTENHAPGLWAILLLSPLLVLRAAQVLAESHRPPPLTTEFRLNWTLFQERSWELHAGSIVLLWLVLTYDQPVSEGLAPLFVLGAIPAMQPLGALGRMVLVLPVYLVLALLGVFEPDKSARTPKVPIPHDPMDLVHRNDGWSARTAGLVRVAWLPLMAVLVTRAVSGW
jgi:Zn-dependent membrane protease YugP